MIFNLFYFLIYRGSNNFRFHFQLSCTVKQTNKKRTIPVIVRVSDINDNAPKFINTPYETTVPEVSRHKISYSFEYRGAVI